MTVELPITQPDQWEVEPWWLNFRTSVEELVGDTWGPHLNLAMDTELADWGATLDQGIVTFESEEMATLFLLRWS